jgi:hypothetical protein
MKSGVLTYTIDGKKIHADWNQISLKHVLTSNFMFKYKDKLDWGCISIGQKLTIDDMEKFKDIVNWDLISIFQNLTPEVLSKFRGDLNWKYVCTRDNLSDITINYMVNNLQKYLTEGFRKKIEILEDKKYANA